MTDAFRDALVQGFFAAQDEISERRERGETVTPAEAARIGATQLDRAFEAIREES